MCDLWDYRCKSANDRSKHPAERASHLPDGFCQRRDHRHEGVDEFLDDRPEGVGDLLEGRGQCSHQRSDNLRHQSQDGGEPLDDASKQLRERGDGRGQRGKALGDDRTEDLEDLAEFASEATKGFADDRHHRLDGRETLGEPLEHGDEAGAESGHEIGQCRSEHGEQGRCDDLDDRCEGLDGGLDPLKECLQAILAVGRSEELAQVGRRGLDGVEEPAADLGSRGEDLSDDRTDVAEDAAKLLGHSHGVLEELLHRAVSPPLGHRLLEAIGHVPHGSSESRHESRADRSDVDEPLRERGEAVGDPGPHLPDVPEGRREIAHGTVAGEHRHRFLDPAVQLLGDASKTRLQHWKLTGGQGGHRVAEPVEEPVLDELSSLGPRRAKGLNLANEVLRVRGQLRHRLRKLVDPASHRLRGLGGGFHRARERVLGILHPVHGVDYAVLSRDDLLVSLNALLVRLGDVGGQVVVLLAQLVVLQLRLVEVDLRALDLQRVPGGIGLLKSLGGLLDRQRRLTLVDRGHLQLVVHVPKTSNRVLPNVVEVFEGASDPAVRSGQAAVGLLDRALCARLLAGALGDRRTGRRRLLGECRECAADARSSDGHRGETGTGRGRGSGEQTKRSRRLRRSPNERGQATYGSLRDDRSEGDSGADCGIAHRPADANTPAGARPTAGQAGHPTVAGVDVRGDASRFDLRLQDVECASEAGHVDVGLDLDLQRPHRAKLRLGLLMSLCDRPPVDLPLDLDLQRQLPTGVDLPLGLLVKPGDVGLQVDLGRELDGVQPGLRLLGETGDVGLQVDANRELVGGEFLAGLDVEPGGIRDETDGAFADEERLRHVSLLSPGYAKGHQGFPNPGALSVGFLILSQPGCFMPNLAARSCISSRSSSSSRTSSADTGRGIFFC